MGVIVKELKIPLKDSYTFISDDGEKGNVLKNLSKINIFVGENNSGKSRFLRSIVKKEDFEFIPNNKDFDCIKNAIPSLKDEINKLVDKNDKLELKYITTGTSNLEEILDKIKEFDFIKANFDYIEPIINLKQYINELRDGIGSVEPSMPMIVGGQRDRRSISPERVGKVLNELFNQSFKEFTDKLEDIILFYEFKKIYIPILRGLRPLREGRNYQDLYKERTHEDYFQSEISQDKLDGFVTIFTGLDAYNIVNRYSRSNHEKKRLLKDFKIYLKNNFFNGKKIEITASVNDNGLDDVLSVKIGDENEKPIYELGDGIQSIIILTLQLFLLKDESVLIFIEEPEQYLHPGLQRKLIETFLNQKGFENFQFFFTTHSNHFLDVTLDFDNISIFSVKKELDNTQNEEKIPSFIIKNLSEGDTNALELLGVRNSSVFLSNCTLWVEGVTDRHYLRYFLDLYKEEHKDDSAYFDFKEDYHYSFVEYGGNNITHWSFLDKEDKPINVEKLCGRLFLLADKDQGKEERQEQLKETLGEDRVYILDCNEIENLVNQDVLLKIVKNYEKLKDGDPLENINTRFKYDDYKKERLGSFIERTIIKNMEFKKRRGNYQAESGTISDKSSFLEKFKLYTRNWNDLSPEAQLITKKIYNFIKENNS